MIKPQGDREKVARKAEKGYARLFLNLGKTDGFYANQIIELINRNLKKEHIQIGRIDLMQNFSFFEVEEKEAQNVVKALNRANWNGRKVSVEVAGEEAGEGRRGSGSAERRGGKRPFGSSSEKRGDSSRNSRSERSDRAPRADRATKGSDKTDKKKRSDKPSREERGYGARGPKKTDDWQQFFKDKEPDFSEEGWARRKPKKK
jgi:ATP-dependent RNA helicase DeaD